MNTRIKIISSVTNDYGIGYGGDLLVKDKEDMKLFKSYTQFFSVVMGRKTFDSLGNVCLRNFSKKSNSSRSVGWMNCN